ncbi:hypothetical protein ACFSOZ_06890 [Mesorhizobium newzealandense]|uniref:SPOR domain-containing protein n=1 Tax=Mesorhizobium newzealandense TaxID=1300302 RepID=A0ABW4U8L0_9HYPH
MSEKPVWRDVISTPDRETAEALAKELGPKARIEAVPPWKKR